MKLFAPRCCVPAMRTMLVVATLATLPVSPATAQTSAAGTAATAVIPAKVVQQFDIPAGSLESVLNRFGRAAGTLISFSTDTTAGMQSQGLRGSYPVADGLSQILQGSGLEASPQASGGYVVRKILAPASGNDAPGTLPVVNVRAGRDNVSTEDSGSYTIRSMSTANHLNLSPRETPQSVSVVTRQQMDDRNVQSLEDIATMTTGLNLSVNSYERAGLYSRGFPMTYFLQDGMPSSSDADSMGLVTLAMVDHVEVLRGASGIMTGVGAPSGVINMVRKRPTAETQVSMTTSVGSWNDYRTELDASGSLNAAMTLRGRGVVAVQDSDTFMNNYKHRRTLAYGTLDADVSRGTTVSVGLSYNQENNPGSSWYGLPTSSDGSFLPISRSLNAAPDWAYWNKTNTRVFAEVESRFDSGWKIKLSAQATHDISNALVTGTDASGISDNQFALISVGKFHYLRTQKGVEVQAGGPFLLFGQSHDMVLGASYRTRNTNDLGANPPDAYYYLFDALTWNGHGAPQPTVFVTDYTSVTQTRQTGIYGTTRFKLSEPWALLLGARADWFDYAGVSSYLDDVTASRYRVDSKVTPYVGTTYALNRSFSVYGSWTSVFNPQSTVDASGKLLAPITGTNSEVGIKGEFFGGALNASAALFRIRQTNLPLALARSTCPASTACYTASGQVESRGVEMEVAGALTPQWQVSAGYTYANARFVSDSDSGAAGTRYAPDTQPSRSLHVSTMVQLSGAYSHWRVGGAVRAQSETCYASTPVVRQAGYALLDLMATWQATGNLDVRLSVNNMLDKTYYQSIYNATSGNTFGTPRSFMLTARYHF